MQFCTSEAKLAPQLFAGCVTVGVAVGAGGGGGGGALPQAVTKDTKMKPIKNFFICTPDQQIFAGHPLMGGCATGVPCCIRTEGDHFSVLGDALRQLWRYLAVGAGGQRGRKLRTVSGLTGLGS